MSWVPEPQVFLDGVEVTGSTVGSVSVRRGRDTVYSDVNAGFATVQFLADGGFAVPRLGQELVVGVDAGVVGSGSGGDAVGTAVTRDGVFEVHSFTSVGTATFVLDGPALVDVLVVGGGGAGLESGGGAGGLALFTRSLAAGSYTVVVGDGGAVVTGAADGGGSSFDDVVVPGGGGGAGSSGGSGAGGAFLVAGGTGIPPFGNDGGDGINVIFVDGVGGTGGGGGFLRAGQDAVLGAGGGAGGRGIALDFDGTLRDYASGGGGATDAFFGDPSSDAPLSDSRRAAPGGASGGFGSVSWFNLDLTVFASTAGQPNTGGGGGGGFETPPATGSPGGSGVVIVRIPRRLTVFTGTVSDVNVEPVRTADGLLYSYSLTAVGPLARASRRNIFFDGRDQELDGERILAAFTDSFVKTWETYPDISWEDTDPNLTWLDLNESLDIGLVDEGSFDLAALDPADGGYQALAVANESALSGRGVVFETPGGQVGYSSLDGRIAEAGADPLVFSFDDVEVNAFGAALSLGDVVNVAEVDWDGGVVVRSNADEVRDLFRLSRSFRTVLAVEQDAVDFAEGVVGAQGEPRFRLESVSVNLRGGLSLGVRAALLRLPLGRLVRVTDVPAPFGVSVFEGFVEGVEFEVSEFVSRLTLLVSDKAFTVGPVS